MTLEEKKIKVAEFIGPSKFVGLKKHGYWWRPNDKGYTANEAEAGRYTREEAKKREYVWGQDDDVTIHEFSTPNWPGSLDAMSELMALIPDTRQGQFNAELFKLATKRPLSMAVREPSFIFQAITATAPQRFEAFGLTMGLWKEGE